MSRHLFVMIMFAVTIATYRSAVAQCVSPSYLRQISNRPAVLSSTDGLIFLGQRGLVEIHDTSDPALPARISSIPVLGEPTAIESQGDLLFINTWDSDIDSGSLVIVNIATPSAPQVLASITWNDEVQDSAASTNRLCLLTSDGDIRILDTTTPGQPITGSTLSGRAFDSIDIRQNILYATFRDYDVSPTRARLRTFNIADIVNTNIITTIDLGEAAAVPHIDRLGTTLAAIAADRLSLFSLAGSPGNPALLSTTQGFRAGSQLSLVDSSGTIFCHTITRQHPAQVWDITNSAAPTLRSSYSNAPFLLAPVSSHAFLFDGELFCSFSFANPTNPVLVWFNDFGLPGRCLDLHSSGSTLIFPERFTQSSERITLLDAADPVRPILRSSIVLPAGVPLESSDVDGELLAFLTHQPDPQNYLFHLYDVSNPSNPALLSDDLIVENTSTFVNNDISLDGPLGLVEFSDRCLVIDLTARGTPRVASIIPMQPSSTSRLNDGLVVTLVSDASPHFEIHDVSDPDRPLLIASIAEANALEFDLQDRILAVTRSNDVTAIYDLSTPATPTLRSTIPRPGSMTDLGYVHLVGSLCYLSGDSGQAVFSLAVPSSPLLLGEVVIPDYAFRSALIDNTLWALSLSDSLHVIELPDLPVVSEQPISRTPCSGDTVVLTADAQSDTALSFRWRYNGSLLNNGALPNGSIVSGAFSRTLTITNFNTADAGVFNLRFTNACGSVLSANAVIGAGGPPRFLTVPSQRDACPFVPVTMSISTSFPTFTAVRWQAEVPFNSGNFVNLTDFTASTYSVSGSLTPYLTLAPLPGGRLAPVLETRYRAVATNLCGSTTSIAGRLIICDADFNCDLFLDFFDYLDFVDAFAAQAPSADYNADTVIDFFDYLDFVNDFSAGC